MANEQAIAKLRALKAEPGIQMHWQDKIDEVIADLSVPLAPPPLPPVVEAHPDGGAFDHDGDGKVGGSKSKVTTAAHVTSHATHKGK